jgi:hypothetical protein
VSVAASIAELAVACLVEVLAHFCSELVDVWSAHDVGGLCWISQCGDQVLEERVTALFTLRFLVRLSLGGVASWSEAELGVLTRERWASHRDIALVTALSFKLRVGRVVIGLSFLNFNGWEGFEQPWSFLLVHLWHLADDLGFSCFTVFSGLPSAKLPAGKLG